MSDVRGEVCGVVYRSYSHSTSHHAQTISITTTQLISIRTLFEAKKPIVHST